MSQFVPTTFGLDAINTVKGTLEIEGATNLGIFFLVCPAAAGPTTTLSSITTSIIHLNVDLLISGGWTIILPPLASVPVGTKVTFKRETGGRIVIKGSGTDQIDGILAAMGVRFYTAWQAMTLYSDGNRWLIVEYLRGTI